jgi:hypothetical protein
MRIYIKINLTELNVGSGLTSRVYALDRNKHVNNDKKRFAIKISNDDEYSDFQK